MTKILSQQIERLSPEIQVEVLHYVESLLKKKPKTPEAIPQRMTLDRFQEHGHVIEEEPNPPHEFIHYTIW